MIYGGSVTQPVYGESNAKLQMVLPLIVDKSQLALRVGQLKRFPNITFSVAYMYYRFTNIN